MKVSMAVRVKDKVGSTHNDPCRRKVFDPEVSSDLFRVEEDTRVATHVEVLIDAEQDQQTSLS